MRLRVLALLGGLLLLLLPATAFAQSAGDEQYSDPFATPPPAKAPSTPSPSAPSSGNQQAGTPSSSGTGTSSTQGTTSSTPSSTASGSASSGSTSSSDALPRTGSSVWMLALLGGLMVLGGLLLRLGLRPYSRRAGGASPTVLGRDVRLTRRARR
jgi:LPXTG-motif cell wall-anchored protein